MSTLAPGDRVAFSVPVFAPNLGTVVGILRGDGLHIVAIEMDQPAGTVGPAPMRVEFVINGAPTTFHKIIDTA